MKQKSNFIKFTNVLFVIYIASLLSCGIFFYYRIKVLDASFEEVSNSTRVRNKIRQVESEVKTAESAQRGFLLTDDSSFLEHFNISNQNALNIINAIKTLKTDSPLLYGHIDELRIITSARIAMLKETMDLHSRLLAPTDSIKTHLQKGKILMDSLVAIVSEMTSIEGEQLADKRKSNDEAIALTPKYVFGILLFSVFIITCCYIALLKFYNEGIT